MLDDAARRELVEKTGLREVFLEHLYTLGNVKRDPHERVVSVATEAKWFLVSVLPPLAFDHADILAIALTRLCGKLTSQPIGFELLPPNFTLTQLQHLYEAFLGRPLDKRNFRKKALIHDHFIPRNEKDQKGPHRLALPLRSHEV